VNISEASSRTHFLMAIAAALIISIALTSTAAIAGLVSKPRVAAKSAPMFMPLAERLVAASVLSAESAAVLYAPASRQGALVPGKPAPAAR
jgi:hypothetical protein